MRVVFGQVDSFLTARGDENQIGVVCVDVLDQARRVLVDAAALRDELLQGREAVELSSTARDDCAALSLPALGQPRAEKNGKGGRSCHHGATGEAEAHSDDAFRAISARSAT